MGARGFFGADLREGVEKFDVPALILHRYDGNIIAITSPALRELKEGAVT
jgi:hypothetical protein